MQQKNPTEQFEEMARNMPIEMRNMLMKRTLSPDEQAQVDASEKLRQTRAAYLKTRVAPAA